MTVEQEEQTAVPLTDIISTFKKLEYQSKVELKDALGELRKEKTQNLQLAYYLKLAGIAVVILVAMLAAAVTAAC